MSDDAFDWLRFWFELFLASAALALLAYSWSIASPRLRDWRERGRDRGKRKRRSTWGAHPM